MDCRSRLRLPRNDSCFGWGAFSAVRWSSPGRVLVLSLRVAARRSNPRTPAVPVWLFVDCRSRLRLPRNDSCFDWVSFSVVVRLRVRWAHLAMSVVGCWDQTD